MKRNFRAIVATLALLPLAVLLGVAACNSVSGIDDLSFTAGACTTAADCPASTNECAVAECVGGFCATTLLDGVNASKQVPGDCKMNRCRDGRVIVENDDFDLLVTATDCDEEKCENGQSLNSVRAEREGCNTSGGQLCNGQGVCVECLQASDCAGSSNPCMQAVCEANGKCVLHPVPENVPIAKQLPGDCQLTVCDGAGSMTNAADDADIEDDANECTMDSCVSGVPTHPPLAEGTACGQGLFCDASGQCAGCTSDSQCNMPQTCGGGGTAGVCACTAKTCESEGRTCGLVWDGCSKYIYCDNGSQDGDEQGIDCGDAAKACNPCSLGVKCISDGDCLTNFCVDGVCCNETCTGTCRACSATAKGGGVDGICGPIWFGLDPSNECEKTDASGCGTNGVCNGAGACAKYDNGTICKIGSCHPQTGGSTEYTEPSRCFHGICQEPTTLSCAGLCGEEGCIGCTTTGECPSGSFCDANACKPKLFYGAACTENEACSDGFCADGVCCNNACLGTCQSCNQGGTNNGTCLPVAVNNPDPDTCATNEVCSADGDCKLVNGQPATKAGDCVSNNVADGVCCDTACTETCKGCNEPGFVGNCKNLSAGQSEPNGCTAPNVCDGAGGCRKSIGTMCGEPGGLSCENGSSCVDGYCCNEACGSTCHACNVAGALGYCVLVPFDMPDPITCEGNKRCDSLGQCKDIAGQMCNTNAECLNDNCVDGYCCSMICSGTCMSCSSSGQCEFVLVGESDPDTCSPGTVCDGAGACKKINGVTCSMANECASAFCTDGVCCDSVCNGVCESCGTGTCTGMFGVPDPGLCSVPSLCGGSGKCLAPNGSACANGSNCLSGYCVDGLCCENSCTSICHACNLPPNAGTCTNLPAGTIDTCASPSACNGYGACWKTNGNPCSNATECLSGFCIEGVCCDDACTSDCATCKKSGSVGTCTPWPPGEEVLSCTNPYACDGAGICKKMNGQSCSITTECLSGLCIDGYCCNTSCSGICQACNVGIYKGTCHNVIQNDPDPDTCTGINACNGQGDCKSGLGQACQNDLDCASGKCGGTPPNEECQLP